MVRPHGPPCGHFGGQSSPVATPGTRPPGKGRVEWKEAKGNLVVTDPSIWLIESLFTLNVHPAGYPWPSASLAGVFRTAIVPDEPIRAKGAGWRNFSPTLHFRRHPPQPEYLALLSRYSLERSPGGTSSGLRPDSPVYLRTAIVPDEPIRAKGTEWGTSSPLTLHLRRCPTSDSSPLCRALLGLPSLLAFTRLATASFLGLRLRRLSFGSR